MKRCSKCELRKTLNSFHQDANSPDGHVPVCKNCRSEYSKRRVKTRSPEERRRLADQRISWLERVPGRRDKISLRRRLRTHGLTEETYFAMLAQQNKSCAICGVVLDLILARGRTAIAIDHCHATGQVRQLLCGNCNLGIGHFKDSPTLLRQAAEYLEKHETKT